MFYSVLCNCISLLYFVLFSESIVLYSVPFQLQLGVEFEASARMQDTSVTFGYQLDLPKANLLFKGKAPFIWK